MLRIYQRKSSLPITTYSRVWIFEILNFSASFPAECENMTQFLLMSVDISKCSVLCFPFFSFLEGAEVISKNGKAGRRKKHGSPRSLGFLILNFLEVGSYAQCMQMFSSWGSKHCHSSKLKPFSYNAWSLTHKRTPYFWIYNDREIASFNLWH